MQDKTDHQYDAIIIGAGMSGSYAAKELCDKGMKTLILERGRNVEHIKDYPTYKRLSNHWYAALGISS